MDTKCGSQENLEQGEKAEPYTYTYHRTQTNMKLQRCKIFQIQSCVKIKQKK